MGKEVQRRKDRVFTAGERYWYHTGCKHGREEKEREFQKTIDVLERTNNELAQTVNTLQDATARMYKEIRSNTDKKRPIAGVLISRREARHIIGILKQRAGRKSRLATDIQEKLNKAEAEVAIIGLDIPEKLARKLEK
jgi:pantothenate kinase